MFRSLDISTSGLAAQRLHMDTIAGNIANVQTTRDEEGKVAPFQRRFVRFQADDRNLASDMGGQAVSYEVQIDRETPPRVVHEPGHRDADKQGNVSYPNVNLVSEFVNALQASRAYEANVATMEVTKNMISQTLKILA